MAGALRNSSACPSALSARSQSGSGPEESVRDILELGEGVTSLGHEDDKVLAACWQDYFELIALAKNGGFEDPDRSGRWKGIPFCRTALLKLPGQEQLLELGGGDQLPCLPQHPLPPEVIQYLYDTLKLETVGTSSAKKTYQPLLDAILPVPCLPQLPLGGPPVIGTEHMGVFKKGPLVIQAQKVGTSPLFTRTRRWTGWVLKTGSSGITTCPLRR